jgi:long-subunit acyl-CoA synthetase (AMP-forming)
MTYTAIAIFIDDFIPADDTQVAGSDITARIDELTSEIREQLDEGNEADEDLVAEKEQLIAFRDDVERVTDNHFDEATIVPANRFTDLMREWAEENHEVSPALADYVNWKRFAGDCKGDYRRLDFGDDVVYVR